MKIVYKANQNFSKSIYIENAQKSINFVSGSYFLKFFDWLYKLFSHGFSLCMSHIWQHCNMHGECSSGNESLPDGDGGGDWGLPSLFLSVDVCPTKLRSGAVDEK